MLIAQTKYSRQTGYISLEGFVVPENLSSEFCVYKEACSKLKFFKLKAELIHRH